MVPSYAWCKKYTIHELHIIHTVHTVHTVQNIHTLLLFSWSDPKTPGPGSSILSTPPGALSPQHMTQSGGQLFCM
ncbi:hypothetical protein DPO88_12825 [Salmonella enterica subsp. enterica]|nr:hypothetical protein [Salmonella enterica subsp. enterica serovar Typhimurium]